MQKSLDYIVQAAIKYGLDIHIVQTKHPVVSIPVFSAYTIRNDVLVYSPAIWCTSCALEDAVKVLGFKGAIFLDWV